MSLMSLVSYAQQVEAALAETGEITPEIEALLAVVESELPTKVDSYHFAMDRFEATADLFKERAKKMSEAAKAFDALSAKLYENIKLAMLRLNSTEISGYNYRFKLQATNPAVIVEDKTLIPKEYRVIEQIETIDLKQIAEDLKLGVVVPGTSLKQGHSVRCYVNKGAKNG